MSVKTLNHTSPGLFSWSTPTYLLNGFFTARVQGSPGQGSDNSNTPGDGFGGWITGNIPATAGMDSWDLYVADGGPGGFGGAFGLNQGGIGGVGQGSGFKGGDGGSSSAVVRHSDAATMIEAAGGGGMGGYQSSAKAPYIAGNGGSAGNGTGVQGSDGSNGGSVGIGGTPIGAGTAATTGNPGAGGTAPAPSTGPGAAGTPTGSGAGGAARATGDSTDCGGGGGGGGGSFGGGGGAGGEAQGAGGGGGAGLGYVDPGVFGLSFAGYSHTQGQILLSWTEADAPFAPALTTPANNAYADMATTPTVIFQYRPATDSGDLNQWAFENVTSGMYWNASTQAWSATIVWNSVSYLQQGFANLFVYTFPSGAFTNGAAIQWRVATTESHYNLGTASPAWSATSTVNAAVAPTVTVTAPAYHSDQATVTPTVSWTETLSTGPQSTYQIKVYNAAQIASPGFVPGSSAAFWDSGPVASTSTSVATGALPPGTYRAFVQVADAHNEPNKWGSNGSWTEFTVRLSGVYAAPTFTAVAGTDPDNGAPVTVLTITPTGSPVAATVSAEFSDDGGTTWLPVLTAWHLTYPGSGSVTARDYSIPVTGTTRQYRASSDGTTSISGVTYPATSPWATASASVTSSQWWLSIASDGGGTAPQAGSQGLHRVTVSGTASSSDVPLDTSIEIVETEEQGTFRPFGRSIPVTVRGDLYAEEFDVAFLLDGESEYENFVWMRRQRAVMVLRSDMGPVYYGIIGPERPIALMRTSDRASNPLRVAAFHWVPVDFPTVSPAPVN